jgi:iron complex transport system ATP-binding protein
MKNGKVFQDGSKRDILTESSLGNLFGVPVSVIERDGFYHMW